MIWEISSRLLEVDLLPGPESVFVKIIEELNNEELIFHTSITLKRVFISFCIAMLIGSFFGIYMGRKERLNTFLDDWLVLGLNVPALVIIILCYVWFGLNEVAAILAVSLNKIPMVAVIMREGARSIEQDYVDVGKFYQISKKKFFTKIFLPQLYPYNGVGFKLYGFFQFFDIAGILAYTLVFVLLIIFVEFVIVRPFERKISIWK